MLGNDPVNSLVVSKEPIYQVRFQTASRDHDTQCSHAAPAPLQTVRSLPEEELRDATRNHHLRTELSYAHI
jgi:hypothetical protein